jgi:hypothetical protein
MMREVSGVCTYNDIAFSDSEEDWEKERLKLQFGN